MAAKYTDYGQYRNYVHYKDARTSSETVEYKHINQATDTYYVSQLDVENDWNNTFGDFNDVKGSHPGIVPTPKVPVNQRYATIEDLIALFGWDYLY